MNKSNTQVSKSVPYTEKQKKNPPTRGFHGTQDRSTGLPEESLKKVIDTGTVKSNVRIELTKLNSKTPPKKFHGPFVESPNQTYKLLLEVPEQL